MKVRSDKRLRESIRARRQLLYDNNRLTTFLFGQGYKLTKREKIIMSILCISIILLGILTIIVSN